MMRQGVLTGAVGDGLSTRLSMYGANFPRRVAIGAILIVALLAFEVFNFDTTRYALANLLGQVSFLGLGWATILAIAFCAIDFAGLVRMFTPEKNGEEPREVWFLMGAWLLGATMNALMTWWAVSLTLLNHDFGNEVLSRGQLLQIVPVFVAVLVWLTRILFIGALTVAGEHLLEFGLQDRPQRAPARRTAAPARTALGQRQQRPGLGMPQAAPASQTVPHVTDDVPRFLQERAIANNRPGIRPVVDEAEETIATQAPDRAESPATSSNGHSVPASPRPNGRVRQRPPVPGNHGKNISARPRGRN
ncbi:MAG: hypothetical protein RRC07_02940 [Anaerolineae bacterium]|nr:hypothetical protein [Anaerolineae bacterium]